MPTAPAIARGLANLVYRPFLKKKSEAASRRATTHKKRMKVNILNPLLAELAINCEKTDCVQYTPYIIFCQGVKTVHILLVLNASDLHLVFVYKYLKCNKSIKIKQQKTAILLSVKT